MDNTQLIEVSSETDYQLAGVLFNEYASSLEFDLGFQGFEEELMDLTKQYSRPQGAVILLKLDNKPVGCVGIRLFEDHICELKRMYLRDEARGKGLGKDMLLKSFEIAKDLGYTRMRLDTIKTMESATKLYEKEGFYEIASYRYNPVEGAKYYERLL